MDEFLALCGANATMQRWLGLPAEAVDQFNLHDVVGTGSGKEQFLQHCRLAFSGMPTKFEYLVQPAGQLPRWLQISLQRLPEARLLGIARDIDEHKQELARLNFLFGHDELTGLLNRNAFMRVLDGLPAPAQGSEQALLVIELEQFSRVNDMCGLLAGDELLCQIARQLGGLSGPRDSVARLGGKKFAMLFNEGGTELAYAMACEVRDKLSAIKFACGNSQFEVGASIGFTLLRNDSVGTPYVALSEADSACNYARNLGRNRIHAYILNGINEYRQQESIWISRIASAFENERFQLFYQNIKQIDNGNAIDAHHEILIRMRDENGVYVTPGEFIPAAEKYNLMPLIDRWVIRTIFARNGGGWRSAYAEQCEDAALPLSLCCINISGASLNDEYFPKFLRDQVALHHIPPQAVCFEITETVAINELDKAAQLLAELRAEGFRFALDDFGKGMSSFAYLQVLRVDFLKIDGSLVQNIDSNKIDLCMVQAISRMAQELGIKTIAEYVTNQQVLDMLQAVGVDYVQGYAIHQPEPLP
jgi:diguanylate cyclase (GGDEF)-like protein